MMHISCDRRGVISVGTVVPTGDLTLASHSSGERLETAVSALARLARDNVTHLVPGVPEAETTDAALAAVVAWQERLHRHLSRQRMRGERA